MPPGVEAPGSVQVELWRQPGRLLVHLVNATGDGVRPVAQAVPVHDIQVRVKSPQPREVRLASGRDVAGAFSATETVVTVPQLDLYDVVAIEV